MDWLIEQIRGRIAGAMLSRPARFRRCPFRWPPKHGARRKFSQTGTFETSVPSLDC
jgi:hypothetical protein